MFSNQQHSQQQPELAFSDLHCIAKEVESNSLDLRSTDIVCSRNNTAAHRNPGNKRYNQLIQTYGQHYQACKKRDEKTRLTHKVIQIVSEYGGRFVKFDEQMQQWTELDAAAKKEKVSHALRSVKKRPSLSKKQRLNQKKTSSNSSNNNSNNQETIKSCCLVGEETFQQEPTSCSSSNVPRVEPVTSLSAMMMMSPSTALANLPTTLKNFPGSLKRSPSAASTSSATTTSSGLTRAVSEESQLSNLRQRRPFATAAPEPEPVPAAGPESLEESSWLELELLDFDMGNHNKNDLIEDDAISMSSVISCLESDEDDAIEVFQEWAS